MSSFLDPNAMRRSFNRNVKVARVYLGYDLDENDMFKGDKRKEKVIRR